ncbi:MAG: glycosyl transferase [Chloroflexi bacterium]|nr:glycosyl transferase [Chloroflexota bacterium]
MMDRTSQPPGRTAGRPRRAAQLAERAGLGPFTSVVVPIYNEQATLPNLVATLVASDLVDEVVCVDDGSTDSSREILRTFGRRIALVELPENRGKGGAMAEGVWRAHGSIVVFVDADLLNLSEEHLRALVGPLLDGTARASLGFFPGESGYSRFIARITGPRFTGERAYFRRDLLAHLPRIATTRFGAEVYLNRLYSKHETVVVPLPGLSGLGKEDKRPTGVATREYAGEMLEVTREYLRRRPAWERR